MRGHTLVWHNQLPAWLTAGTFTNDELEAILRRHITDEVAHFRGRVYAWDVVNEAFNEDGTLRDTIWLRQLGPATSPRRSAGPTRPTRTPSSTTTTTTSSRSAPRATRRYALVQDLRRQGVRIDGVGFQGHLGIQYPYPDTLGDNLKRFAALGVDVAMTEADVRMAAGDPEKLATQAGYFSRHARQLPGGAPLRLVHRLGLRRSALVGSRRVRRRGRATPFDESYRPKPAYFALRDALAQHRH